jgi:hypothetical protein
MLSLVATKRVISQRGAQALSSFLVDFLGTSSSSSQQRSYISRAHPRPTPTFSIHAALDTVLKESQERAIIRERKYARNGIENKKYQDETIEFCVNLNVDPRKPGQSLRGSVNLPNGTGKRLNAVVFTSDEALKEKALQAGALFAGGDEFINDVVEGKISVDAFERALATKEIMPTLAKKVARLLGPRGLMIRKRSHISFIFDTRGATVINETFRIVNTIQMYTMMSMMANKT